MTATAQDLPVRRLRNATEAAEESVLAAVLLDAEALDEVGGLLTGADFYAPGRGIIFDALVDLDRNGSPIDTVTLRRHLEAAGKIREAGGDAYLLELTNRIPVVAHVERHAQIVRDQARVRRMGETCQRIRARGADGIDDVSRYLDDAEAQVLAVSQDHRAAQSCAHAGRVVEDVLKRVAEAKDAGGVVGTRTGFRDLDDMVCGLEGGDLVVVAARPRMGKTALALQIADRVSEDSGPALFFSLEMPKAQLVQRLLSSDARVDSTRMRTGRLSTEDFARLAPSCERVHRSRLWIDDQPAITPTQIRSRARRLRRKAGGLSLVAVDYLQLVRPDRRTDSRERDVGESCTAFKTLAKELGIPVLLLAQLNRAVEHRGKDKRPQLSDLRDSGQIEQDADVVVFIHRAEVYDRANGDLRNRAELIVEKQRRGPTGSVHLAWFGEYTRFDNLARDEWNDTPRSTLYDIPRST